MAESDQQSLVQSQVLLPEYQENFLKDLLSNIYNVPRDPNTGAVVGDPTGIAATSPLFGEAVFDEQGNPVFETDADGNVRVDQYGEPIQVVKGGVPRPDVMQFTDAQRQAIEQGVSGIGAYEPMLEKGTQTLDQGLQSYLSGQQALAGTTAGYDPTSYRDFYDPFVEQVIEASDRDIDRAGQIEANKIAGTSVGAGAFGGARETIAQQELAKNLIEQKAKIGAQLRSNAYTGAQQQAQTAFQNQMNRGQSAGQIFGSLGAGIGQLGVSQGALGEAAQSLGQKDVNALFNLGGLEQQQRQSEYDVQRAGAIEEAYEPFQRFSYMSDIFRGVPSTQGSLTATSAPRPNPIASGIGSMLALNAAGNNSLGGLIPRGT